MRGRVPVCRVFSFLRWPARRKRIIAQVSPTQSRTLRGSRDDYTQGSTGVCGQSRAGQEGRRRSYWYTTSIGPTHVETSVEVCVCDASGISEDCAVPSPEYHSKRTSLGVVGSPITDREEKDW